MCVTDVGVTVTNLRVVCKIITCVSALTISQYISCLSVCVCVTDVGVTVTNLRVVCKIITCVSAFTEMVIIKIYAVSRVPAICMAFYVRG